MSEQDWKTSSQSEPPVSWNGNKFRVKLNDLEAEWTPPITYVVRIRESNGGDWSFGFETPLTSCKFTDLTPDTECELEIRAKNEHGLSEPARATGRTSSDGEWRPGGLNFFMPWTG